MAFVLLGFVGNLADKVQIRYALPGSLFVRAFVFFCVYKIKDPTAWSFYILLPMLHVCYYSVLIIQQAYMVKMYPRQIRGMCCALQGIFGSIGSVFYQKYAQLLFKGSKKLPFIGASILDLLTFIIVVALIRHQFFKGEAIED